MADNLLNTEGHVYVVAGPGRPVLNKTTGAQQLDRDGNALSTVKIVDFYNDNVAVLNVRTAVELPKGLAARTAVLIPRLVLTTFSTKEGGTAVMYQAPEGIQLATPAPARTQS